LIFGVLTLISLAAMLVTARLLPETLPPARRVRTGPLRMVSTYGKLIADRRFIVPLITAGFAQSVLLVFISGSPFVFVTLHGLKPMIYGGIFALHAAALIGMNQLNARMMAYFGARRLVRGGAAILAVASIGLLAITALQIESILPFIGLTLTIFTSLGLILAPAFLTAVESFNATAGSAAALGVALELCMSTTATFVLGMTANGTAWPMVIIMACTACASLAGAWGMPQQERQDVLS
jgi:DHA1 family bicyclomycin/chloramphenicol resistance-like MFS transporter